jgi:predicted transcriptional regulator
MALRSYQESNKNFFPEIETKANLFLEDLKTDEVKISELEEILKNRFRYKIDYQLLAKNKNLKELGSVFKKGKEKILFINRILHPTQILFLLGKEIGYCELQLNRGESQSSSFEHHLNEFKASYFSGCLLIPKKLIVEDLEHLFQRNKFPDKEFIKLMKKYKTNAEVLLNRVIQVLSGYFKIDNLFFLRLKSSPDGNTKKLKINKELHFSKLHFAHGIGLPEHYCRRWITVTILEELEKLPKNTPIIRAQKSVMANNGERFFCVAIARKSSLKENTYSCLTVGIPIDKVSEKKIKFLNDPKISEKVVGKTCERCNLSDCDERAYPATIAERIKKKELIKSEINSLLTDNDF